MTRIVYGRYDDRFYLEASGHAVVEELFADCGCDEDDGGRVCAAVSALILTACEMLSELDSRGELSRLVTEIESGYAMLDAAPRYESAEAVEGVFDFLMTGFGLLEENYPECVSCE